MIAIHPIARPWFRYGFARVGSPIGPRQYPGGERQIINRTYSGRGGGMILRKLGGWLAAGTGLTLAVTSTGCSDPQSTISIRERRIALATGSTAMWYRFRLAARYRGEPFRFDQYVHCGLRTIPGGPFGSAPATTNRAMYPRTIGQRMADGSYVIVRVPDMCQIHRAHDAAGVRQIGWTSPGPFEVLPMVVWNDRRPQASVVESYVGRGYYTQPGARITDPHGTVELMPVGFHPATVAVILDQPEFPATDPDETIDPATGRRYLNAFASNNNGLVAFYTVPTVDMAAALARFNEPPDAIARELDIARIENVRDATDQVALWLKRGRELIGVGPQRTVALQRAEGPADGTIASYHDNERYDAPPFDHDPDYLPPATIWRCIHGLAAGRPLLSNLPSEPDVAGVLSPPLAARTVPRAAIERRRTAAACALLDHLVSYDVRDGRLDATGAIPGVIVRRQWNFTNAPQKPSRLERDGVAYRFGGERLPLSYRFRFGATDADVRIVEPHQIIEDRKAGRWLALARDTSRIVGDDTAEGGW